MYPLQFDEFLRAMGNGHLVTIIREHFSSMEQMPEQTHRELLLWLRRYMLVGGMPAAVKKYIEDQSVINVPELQMMILNAYTADMANTRKPEKVRKYRMRFAPFRHSWQRIIKISVQTDP